MRIKKGIITLLLTLCLTLGIGTSALAVTPTYKPHKMPTIPKITTVQLPESTEKAIERAVQEYLKEHPVNVKTEKKTIFSGSTSKSLNR